MKRIDENQMSLFNEGNESSPWLYQPKLNKRDLELWKLRVYNSDNRYTDDVVDGPEE